MSDKYSFIKSELERRRTAGELRSLRQISPPEGGLSSIDAQSLINFSSNDYLGLASHPLLRKRSAEYQSLYGSGATASRSVCGSHPGFQRVEQLLATQKGTESALVLNSGFQANVSLLPVLADRGALILADRLVHSSLIQGALQSRAKLIRFRHRDTNHLRQLLKRNRAGPDRRPVVVTESVFSLDGDRSDLEALVEASRDFDAFLVVDDAHATGVLGSSGMGLTRGVDVDLVVGTFGKACGSFGAYVACSELVRQYIVNCCTGFIYSTALPPSILGSIEAAIELIPGMDAIRQELHAKAYLLRGRLRDQGWNTLGSDTQIVPLLVGESQEAVALSQWLEERGVLAMAIRPPAVQAGMARLRIAVCASHTRHQVEILADLLGQWRQDAG